jgi:hypothetical protein
MALKSDQIDLETFNQVLDKYDSLLPGNLKDLTKFRGQELPDLVASRKQDGEAYVTKDELVKLVEWKLCVTPFPDLLKLIYLTAIESTALFAPNCSL